MPTYPALPYTWTLDGMVFGDGIVARYLTDVTGWAGQTEPKMNKTPKVGAAGDWVGGHYPGPRIIPVKGCWLPGNRTESLAARDALTALCSSGDADTTYVLRRTEGDRDRWTRVILDDALDPHVGRGGLITFDTQLYSSDPRWFSSALQSWGPVGLPTEVTGGWQWNGSTGTSGDGVQWNGSTGTSGDGTIYLTGGAASDGTVVVTNAGSAAAGLTITLVATGGTGLDSPFVTISDTGEMLQYNGILTPGSVVTIDTDTGSVQVNGAYANTGVLKRAQMFRIPANSTRILTFGSQGAGDQGLLSGTHYHTYQGG